MRLFFIWIAWSIPVATIAQQTDSLKALYLQTVNVYGMPVTKYSAGTKVETIELSGTALLNNALSQSPSIYFKNYGNDQLSTIAFRGTSASHTSVLWNGINVGSQTLGQTDFSLLPSFLLEEVSLQYGTSSSLYGSDALGGSVLLNQRKPEFKTGVALQYQQQIGSFGRYFEGLKIQLSNDHWEVRTKIMNRSIKNNFSYYSPAIQYTKKVKNAAVITNGIDQQIHYKISDTKRLSFEALYTFNDRDIQPNNTNDNSKTTLRDRNTRLNLNYQSNNELNSIYTSIGYIRNDQLYNKTDRTLIDQLTLIINIDRLIGSNSSFRYGGNSSLYWAKSSGFAGIKQESRNDLFASFNYKLLPVWILSLNVRQSFYAGHYAPFSPSLGTKYEILKNNVHSVSIRSQLSRGYRVPTLNDRYWNPGGNPNILPEDAFHIEGGITWNKTTQVNSYKAELTAFKTLVDKWILWLPNETGTYSPINLQKVNAYGTEGSFYHKRVGKNSVLQSTLGYSFTRSKNLRNKSISNDATIGKQLPYIPFNRATLSIKYQYKKWQSEINGNYTGYRYTTLNNDSFNFLKSYCLLNLEGGRKIEVKRLIISTLFQINNILNLYYENYDNYAMPGRNYNLNLTINYKTN